MIRKNQKDGGEVNIQVGIPQTQEIDRMYYALQQIKIRHETGTLSGGSSGTYTANSILKSISLRIGTIDIMKQIDADHWRELLKLYQGIALSAEQWTIPLFSPYNLKTQALSLPIVLELNNEALSGIHGGDRTAYSGAKYHIFLDTINKIERYSNAGYLRAFETQFTQKSLGSVASTEQRLNLLSQKIYKGILLYIRDNSAAADALGGKIKVEIGNQTLFETDVTMAKAEVLENYGIASATGYYYIEFPEFVDTRNVLDATLVVNTAASLTAGVDATLIAEHLLPL